MTSSPRPWVKICGVTCREDAELCVELGADAIGLNFVPSSRRYIDAETGAAIARALAGRVEVVGVFANEPFERLCALKEALALDWLQLHGDEPEALVARLPRAFKAIGVATHADVDRALAYPGDRLLLDAKVPTALGGTGTRFDWSLLAGRHLSDRVVVAGGLRPDNVGELVREVAPFGVDVASGVETATDPRRKDPAKVEAFVRAARGAA